MDGLWQDTNIFYKILCFLVTENEKLFDRSDAKLYWRTVFHIFALIHHGYVGIFAANIDLSSDKADIKVLNTFRVAYLTGWNFTFQTIFLILSLYVDFLDWLDINTFRKKLEYWRDVLFCGVVLPSTLFVAAMFWVLYSIDRELVFPVVYDEIVPWWFNHCVHTTVVFVVLAEAALLPRRRPADLKMELVFNTSVVVAYALVYYSIYFTTNIFLYKVFAIMNWWQICIYQFMIWASYFCFYKAQYPISRLLHGSDDKKVYSAVVQDYSAVVQDYSAEVQNYSAVVTDNSVKITDTSAGSIKALAQNLRLRRVRGGENIRS